MSDLKFNKHEFSKSKSTCIRCNVSYINWRIFKNKLCIDFPDMLLSEVFKLRNEKYPCISDDEYIIKKLIE